MSKYSVIVPVYRAEASLERLTERLVSFFQQKQLVFEIVFVYDRGPGNSWEVITQLLQRYPQYIKAVKLSRNFGQHNATICGFKYATGDFFITMDEDLQHRPEDLSLLIEEQKRKDFDIVYGKFDTLKHSFFRSFTSNTLKKMLEVSIPDLHPDYTSFRLIRGNIARAALGMNNSYTFLDGFLSWVTTHVSSVEVTHELREEGKSAYTVGKLVNHAINIFVTFSILPIRLVTISSIIIFLASVLYSLYLVSRKLFFRDLVSGYASTMVLLGIGIGLILFSLGMIGEYIHRINLKTTRKPNFLEAEVLDMEEVKL